MRNRFLSVWQLGIRLAVLVIFLAQWAAMWCYALLLAIAVPQRLWPSSKNGDRLLRVLWHPGRVWEENDPWWLTLSDRDLRYCDLEGVDPVEYARAKG